MSASKAASKAVSSSRPFRILALPLVRLPRAASSSNPSATPSQSPLDPNPPAAPSSNSASPHDAGTSSSTSAMAPSPTVPRPTTGSKTPLMLYQVLQPPPSPESGPPSYTTRALNKASETWLKIGEKPKDSWMYWFYSKGESLMDRIEYEEWSLKGIHEGQGFKIANKEKGETQERIEIALLHPQLKETPLPTLLPKLHRMLIHRIPYHRKMMWRSILLYVSLPYPPTWPFALIPVIPNFPLFYVLWRAWSHYKAWRGALYLEQLLKLGMIVEKPSESLTEIYETSGAASAKEGEENLAPDRTATPASPAGASGVQSESVKGPDAAAQGVGSVPPQAAGKSAAPDGTTTPSEMIYPSSSAPSSSSSSDSASSSSTSAPPAKENKKTKPRHPNVLLRPNQVPLLTKAFGLKQTEIIDINRAVEQANARALKAAQAEAEAKGEKTEDQKPATNWRGNLHR